MLKLIIGLLLTKSVIKYALLAFAIVMFGPALLSYSGISNVPPAATLLTVTATLVVLKVKNFIGGLIARK